MKMKIEYRKIQDIKPYDSNPRKNDHAVDMVAMSLEKYGWQQPIVVDGNGVIVVGHTRYKAAIKLGMNECPVVVADGLSPEKVIAYRIADNRTGEIAEFDEILLGHEINKLIDYDFNIDFTGFSADDFKASERKLSVDDIPLHAPKMSWALVGIPVLRFGEIQKEIDIISGVEGIIVKTTVSNG